MDDYQVQLLEHVNEISTNVKDINDLGLEQLVLQTQIEFIILCALLIGLGIWLFNWGVNLWKRWWL